MCHILALKSLNIIRQRMYCFPALFKHKLVLRCCTYTRYIFIFAVKKLLFCSYNTDNSNSKQDVFKSCAFSLSLWHTCYLQMVHLENREKYLFFVLSGRACKLLRPLFCLWKYFGEAAGTTLIIQTMLFNFYVR